MECTFCEQTFTDSYNLFKHIQSHKVTWRITPQRQERFKITDLVPELRMERFNDPVFKLQKKNTINRHHS